MVSRSRPRTVWSRLTSLAAFSVNHSQQSPTRCKYATTVCHLKRVRPFSVRSEACNQSSFFDLTTARSQDFKSSKPAERGHCRVEGQSTRVAAAAALLDFHSARQCRRAGNGMVSGQDGPSTTTVCCLTIHTLPPICPRDDLYPSGWRVQRR